MREEITRRTGRGAAGEAAGDGALDAMMTAVPMRLGNDEQGDSGRADGRRVEGRRVEVGLPEHAALPQGEAWVVDPPEPRTGAGGSMHCVRLLAPGAGTLPLGALPPDPRVAAGEWIRLAQGDGEHDDVLGYTSPVMPAPRRQGTGGTEDGRPENGPNEDQHAASRGELPYPGW